LRSPQDRNPARLQYRKTQQKHPTAKAITAAWLFMATVSIETAYESYRSFCTRLGIQPMPQEQWLGMPQVPAATSTLLARPKRDPIHRNNS
jgi:hypothetical protein